MLHADHWSKAVLHWCQDYTTAVLELVVLQTCICATLINKGSLRNGRSHIDNVLAHRHLSSGYLRTRQTMADTSLPTCSLVWAAVVGVRRGGMGWLCCRLSLSITVEKEVCNMAACQKCDEKPWTHQVGRVLVVCMESNRPSEVVCCLKKEKEKPPASLRIVCWWWWWSIVL
jgi:hypothetical protein